MDQAHTARPQQERSLRHPDADALVAPSAMTAVSAAAERGSWLRWGYRLALLTIAWNVIEGIVAVAAGARAESVALLGFGMDSFIETVSALVVAWRLRAELSGETGAEAERIEQRAARAAGALLLLLAAYIAFDAGRRLMGYGGSASESRLGIAITTLSLLVMPLLAWPKLRVADRLGSGALRADAYETITCAWLSVTTLAGLLLNAAYGWSWADPAAALLLLPLIVREGLEGFGGHQGCHDHHDPH